MKCILGVGKGKGTNPRGYWGANTARVPVQRGECSPQMEGDGEQGQGKEEEEVEEGWEQTSSSIWEGKLHVMHQAAPARAWIWCEAGEVTVTGISGMSLANTQDVICDRARGRRDEIPSIQPSLAGSGRSEMVAQHRGLPT